MREVELRRIVAALGIQIEEKTGTGWLHARCPFSEWTHRSGIDRRPSFGAKIEDGGFSSYHCYSCGMHGRIRDLAHALGSYQGDRMRYHILAMEADTADTMGLSAEPWDGSHEVEQPPQALVEEIYGNIYPPVTPHDPGGQYLASRGIGLGTADAIGIAWDAEQSRVLLPVRGRTGGLFGWTGRAVVQDVRPKVRDYAGLRKRWCVLGADRWHVLPGDGSDRPPRPLIIVEGLFGYLHLIELNVEAVADVGCIMGSHLSDHQAEIIIAQSAAVFLVLDNDEAGDKGLYGRMDREGNRDWPAGAVGMLVDHVPVHVPAWPEGKEDPDQLTKRDLWDMLRYTPRHPRIELSQPVPSPVLWT